VRPATTVPGHGAQHRQADAASDLAAEVEQAGGHPGVCHGDAAHGRQLQRDDEQAEPGPGEQARAEQAARVRTVLGHPG
jgi:hypothetical protein